MRIEICELLPPAANKAGIRPVEAAVYSQKVVKLAQKLYHDEVGAIPMRVIVYFGNRRAVWCDPGETARKLAEFVRENAHQATPVANFCALQLPEGFRTMSIASGNGDGTRGEPVVLTIDTIWEVLHSRITEKEKLFPGYRKALGTAAQVWLLVHTTAEVSRSVPIPYDIEKWRFESHFDKFYWYSSFERRFVEIQLRRNPRSQSC